MSNPVESENESSNLTIPQLKDALKENGVQFESNNLTLFNMSNTNKRKHEHEQGKSKKPKQGGSSSSEQYNKLFNTPDLIQRLLSVNDEELKKYSTECLSLFWHTAFPELQEPTDHETLIQQVRTKYIEGNLTADTQTCDLLCKLWNLERSMGFLKESQEGWYTENVSSLQDVRQHSNSFEEDDYLLVQRSDMQKFWMEAHLVNTKPTLVKQVKAESITNILNTANELANAAITQSKSKIENAETHQTTIANLISNHETAIANLISNIAAHETTIATLTSNVATHETTIKTLNNTVNQLEQDNTCIKGRLAKTIKSHNTTTKELLSERGTKYLVSAAYTSDILFETLGIFLSDIELVATANNYQHLKDSLKSMEILKKAIPFRFQETDSNTDDDQYLTWLLSVFIKP